MAFWIPRTYVVWRGMVRGRGSMGSDKQTSPRKGLDFSRVSEVRFSTKKHTHTKHGLKTLAFA